MDRRVAQAFAVWAGLANLNGRRLQRAYELHRARWVEVQVGSPMLKRKTAPRAERREIARQSKTKFRPIYGFLGCSS